MQINDAFRRIVLGHLKLLIVFVLVPVLVVATLSSHRHTSYAAFSRIQASSSTNGSDTEADSVLNRVKGVATSTAVVAQALKAARITDRSAAKVADSEVDVTRLGSSSVLDISVTDERASVAEALASALGTTVVAFLTGPGSVRSQPLLKDLTGEQRSLYAQRKSLVATMNALPGTAQTANLSAQLSTIDQQLADVAATLRQLQIAAATDSSATVISGAAAAKAVAASTGIEYALAVLAGVVLALIVGSVLEVVRPRVADARAYSRELGVPLLGRFDVARTQTVRDALRLRGVKTRRTLSRPASDGVPSRRVMNVDTVVALRQAAIQARAHTLVLVAAGEQARLAEIARLLSRQVDAPTAARGAGTNGAEPNGHRTSSSGTQAAANGGALMTATRPRTHPADRLPASGSAARLKVVTIAGVDRDGVHDGHALLVVAPPLASYESLRGVADLSAATGWPVLGVLSARRGSTGSRS